MIDIECIVIGGGPCGLSAAIELEEKGIKTIVIEKGNVVQAIYDFPTHQTFFSSSEKLEIGDVAFITDKAKPRRLDALAYYRSVVQRKDVTVHSFEEALSVQQENQIFIVETKTDKEEQRFYRAKFVVIATGYYRQPNELQVKGAHLPHVSHYFKEGHPYFQKNVAVIGGRNSAVDAALELHRSGAHVSVLYRGSTYSESIKPWILPEFESLVEKSEIQLFFDAEIKEITKDLVVFNQGQKRQQVDVDFVFAMIGYKPNISFLQKANVVINKDTGIPLFNKSTYETNIERLYLAGVVTAGFNNNAVFIENGRFHGKHIANHIAQVYKTV